MRTTIFVILLFIMAACSKNEADYQTSGNGTEINIYLVKAGQIETYYSSDITPETLDLEKKPWLKHDEIDFYDWSSHIFYLKKGKERKNPETWHFVLKANEDPILLGYFFSSFMSSIPPFPSIIHDDFFYPADVIGFGGFGFDYDDEKSTAQKEKLRVALINSGLLHEGIALKILDVTKTGTHSLKYTFQITNRDIENIYVLDPYEMGTARFHYYTNGVSLWDGENYYWANNFESVRTDEIKENWYAKLSPGESIVRTVELDGYSSLPGSDNVKATFSFSAANLKEVGQWRKKNGRIWMGSCKAEMELDLR